MEPAWTEELDRHLGRLLGGGPELEGGAELEVRDPDGRQAFLAPLARHHRMDETGTLWVRPVVGGHVPNPDRPGTLPYTFDPNTARRRGLDVRAAQRHGDELVLELRTGQQARIRPARPALLAELSRWDTWVYTALTPQQEAELEALSYDAH